MTEGAEPLHIVQNPKLTEVAIKLAARKPPTTVISLGEGHHPRCWLQMQAWWEAGIFGSQESHIHCIDPVYINPLAIPFYLSKFKQGLAKNMTWHTEEQIDMETTDPNTFTYDTMGTSIHFYPLAFPSLLHHEGLWNAEAKGDVWLNLINVLNYVNWSEFESYLRSLLPRIKTVTFANKVNANRDMIDRWMHPGRLIDNTVVTQILEESGFELIWETTGLVGGKSLDIGCVYSKVVEI